MESTALRVLNLDEGLYIGPRMPFYLITTLISRSASIGHENILELLSKEGTRKRTQYGKEM